MRHLFRYGALVVLALLATATGASAQTKVYGVTATDCGVGNFIRSINPNATISCAAGSSLSVPGVSGDLMTNNGASGLGALTPAAGVANLLASFTSANLRAALTDESGIGAAVFGTNPTISQLILGDVLGATQCLHVNSAGLISGTGSECGTGSGGLVPGGASGSIQTNSGSGTLNGTTPATGVMTLLAAFTSANLRAALTDESGTGPALFGTGPTITALTLGDVTGGTQCLHANVSGVVSGSGSDCGTSSGSPLTVTDGTTPVTNVTQLTLGTGLQVSGSGGLASANLVVVPNNQVGASYTIGSTDANKVVNMTSGSATTVTLPTTASVGSTFGTMLVCDAGCTVGRSSGDLINNATSISIPARGAVYLSGNAVTAWRAQYLPGGNPQDASNLTVGVAAVSVGGTGQTAYTNGQLLIGNTTTGGLTKTTLTAGTGVTITNAPGSITIAATGTGGVAGPGSSVNGNLASWNGTGGNTLADSGVLGSSVLVNGGNAGTPSAIVLTNSTDDGSIPGIGWVAGAVLSSGTVFTVPTGKTARVTHLIGTIETVSGGTTTIAFFKANNAQACSAGVQQVSSWGSGTSFDANGTVNTNQEATLAGSGANDFTAGQRLCWVASGAGWTSSHLGNGGVTVRARM